MTKRYSLVDFIRLKGNLDFYCDDNLKIDYTQVLFGTTVVDVEANIRGFLQSFLEKRSLMPITFQTLNEALFVEEINKCYIPIYTLKGNNTYNIPIYILEINNK
ncbi:hypothetical protein [Alistipes onderdonkii]|uniref:hypothetical protein n=1 Tax=Alistipes onderdonkii TaxID=328813 RepID=UPI00050A095F|nr:hypothetical protein [Alistipes onderdonkii]